MDGFGESFDRTVYRLIEKADRDHKKAYDDKLLIIKAREKLHEPDSIAPGNS